MPIPFLAAAALGAGAGLGLGTKGGRNFLFGTPEKRENVSTLRPEQEGLYKQLINAGMAPGAGGAFGQSADYYRNLLSDENADYNAFAAPALRQFNQDIVPGIAEQFAGFGAGGLNSSGFRNAQLQAGTDLAERLGALRANLRQSGAQGLANIASMGLSNFSQPTTTQQGSQGFLGSIAPAIGSGIGMAVGGPIGAGIGSGLGSMFGGSSVGNQTSPYQGSNIPASPVSRGLPNFSTSMNSFGMR